MAKTLELPALGNSMEEGTITQWFKTEGEFCCQGRGALRGDDRQGHHGSRVARGGVLRKILAPVDAVVPVNSPVAILGTADEDISGLAPSVPNSGAPAPDSVAAPDSAAAPDGGAGEEPAGAGMPGRVFASPRARRYADEYGVDIALLVGRGTGVDGRVVEADVVAFYRRAASPEKGRCRASRRWPSASPPSMALPPKPSPGTGYGGKVTQDDVKRAVAPPAPLALPPALLPRHSWQEPGGNRRHPARDAEDGRRCCRPQRSDRAACHAHPARRHERGDPVPAADPARHRKIPWRSRFVYRHHRQSRRAGLRDHPYLNSTLARNEITLHDSVHLGIAVSLGTDGLIVPVVKDAQAKSLGEFSKALKELVVKAKNGTLASDEVTGERSR